MPLFLILTYATLVPVLIGVVLSELLRRRLRRSHPAVWRSIGEPGPLEGTKVGRFVRSRGDRALGDASILRLSDALRVARWAFFVLGAGWWAVAVLERPRLGIPVTLLSLAMVGLIHMLNRKRRGAA